MDCPHCHSSNTRKLAKKTVLGYDIFSCRDCRRQFNERTGTLFNRLQVPTDIAEFAVRWYLKGKLSLRDLVDMLSERGFQVSYETIRNWVHLFSPLIAAELRKRRRGKCPKKWHVDETYIKLNGKWWYLWRAIDGAGNLIDARLSEHRDSAACEAFLKQAKEMAGGSPERVVSDGWKGYPGAIAKILGPHVKHEATTDEDVWQYANNRIEQDHRGVKGRTRVMVGMKGNGASSAKRVLRGIEEARQHFRIRVRFREKVPAPERRRRYNKKLNEFKEIFIKVA